MSATSLALDETQVQYLKEECILVDETDKMIGHASKKQSIVLQSSAHAGS